MRVVGAHHVSMLTPNIEGMEAFYVGTLGFPVTRRWDDAGVIFIRLGGIDLELCTLDNPSGQPGPHALDEGIGLNHIALEVENVDEACRELEELGVTAVAPPADFGNSVRIAFFADPDGNVLELVQEL